MTEGAANLKFAGTRDLRLTGKEDHHKFQATQRAHSMGAVRPGSLFLRTRTRTNRSQARSSRSQPRRRHCGYELHDLELR